MKILFCFGTRPEAIKLLPLINHFKKNSNFEVKICVTAQHRQMLDQVLDFFKVIPDYDLDVMFKNQGLSKITGLIIDKINDIIQNFCPDLVIVQGDTTTTFASALSAFYNQIHIAHVEAGLRTYHKYSPFPEEINRRMVSHLADIHFAPTKRAKDALIAEGINKKDVYLVGNTIVDALLYTKKNIDNKIIDNTILSNVDFSKKIILVTCHRRESFDHGIRAICSALKEISSNENIEIIIPVHLNPKVKSIIEKMLSNIKNIHLVDPLSYENFVWVLDKSFMVLTDSGGVQEEAPTFNKPILILRDVTERKEVIDQGFGVIVGTDKDKIVEQVHLLLNGRSTLSNITKKENPYGDGNACKMIEEIVVRKFL